MSDKKTQKIGTREPKPIEKEFYSSAKNLKNNSTIQKKNIVLVIENKFHNSGKKKCQ